MGVAVAESLRAILAESDALIARVRANASLEHASIADLTAGAVTIADEWLAYVERLANQNARDGRKQRRLRPSVTAQLMAQRTSPTGQAA
jgi:hypothetical protein